MKKISAAKTAALFRGTEAFVTLGDWLRYAVSLFHRNDLFFAQGTRHAGDEALALLKHVLMLDEDVQPFLQARLTRAEIGAFKEVLTRRILGREPLAYIVGEAWLGGHRFAVDSRVLIPRSYFVELLENGLPEFLGKNPVRRAMDICTGSGCLGILIAHQFPSAVVDAIDISPDAIEVAQANVIAHGLEKRVHVLQSDLFDAVVAQPYDLIIANPPYEPSGLCADLPPEMQHEPQLALDGGSDGMVLVRRILKDSVRYLAPHGVLAIELGGLRSAVEAEFPKLKLFWPELSDGTEAVCVVRARDLRKI